ncbi:kinase-like protein [Marasmius fiardii PR-910]|nr:kinase-like protein [Marasmius fiardii PR-910]
MLAPLKPTSPIEFEQVLRHIQGIIENEQQRKELLGTKGDTAQQWLDLFQLLAEYPDVPNNLRPSIFKLMIRLSRKSGLHPQCLTIQGVEKLGNYPVGGGAFGDVWRGKIGEQLVCLKVIRAFNRSDVQHVLKDYMQEGILWRQLNHPNVLPFMGIYYLDTEQRQLCLVSPWMEQGNLVEFLKASDDLADRVLLAYDVACGLAHLHEAGIVHGDLKGVNILITPDLRACITDFGLSRVSATLPLLTETSRSRGTTRWLSPELLTPDSNCVSSRQSDVYAYACVCYEIFTGNIPFYELAEAKIVIAVYIHKWRPSRPQDCPHLHDSMWEMMGVCWNETPSLRPTMADVLVRVKKMNLDRQLELASDWDNFAFTQMWRHVDHPPDIHTREPMIPQSRNSDLQSNLHAPFTARALHATGATESIGTLGPAVSAPIGNPRILPPPLTSFEENDLRPSSGSYDNVRTPTRPTHSELAWTPAMASFLSLTWPSSLDGQSSFSEVRAEPEGFESLPNSNSEDNTLLEGGSFGGYAGAEKNESPEPPPPLTTPQEMEQLLQTTAGSVSYSSWESSEPTSDGL